MKIIALAKYNESAWKGMIGSSYAERRKVMEAVVSSAGATLTDMMFTRGQYDIVVTFEVPSEDVALGAAIAVNASGAIKELVTLSEIDIDSALKTAKSVASSYSPPGT